MANPGDNNYLSTRDGMQVLRAAFDDNTKRLRTDSTFTGSVSVDLDAADDSVSIGDSTGTNFLAVNPDGSINVGNFPATQDVNVVSSVEIEIKNDAGNPIPVTATDFDIRDLNASQDNVAISDGTDTLQVNADGSINTQIEGEVSIEVSAADGDNIAIANQAGTQFMAVNADGSINVDQNSSPWVVSGTVTANIGTTGGLALDTTLANPQGSTSGGTAGTKSELAGGIFNTVAPTLTNGQQAALQLDSSGNLKTTATVTVPGTVAVTQSTTPWVDNITQFGSNPVVTGTGASGVGIPRVTVSNDSTVGLNTGTNTIGKVDQGIGGASAWKVDGSAVIQPVSGTVTANQGTTPWADNITQFGSNPVVTGTGTSGVGIPRVTVSNDSNILATQSGTWTVTANAGTNLNTSALALDTSVTGLQVTQGSTTSGEKGPLVQGAVTTAAPTYTTGQTNPLSLTTSGALRVDNSANTQPVSGTVNAKAATPTAGTVTQAAITVGTSAVRATVSGAAPSATRSVLLVSPDSASTAKFYMGSSSVTNTGATRGFQLLGGDQVAFSSDAGDYYIISDTAGQTVYITEQA